MRITPLALLVSSLLLAPPGAAGQASPHAAMPEDGEAFCGRVFLRADGRAFGHEYVEFLHRPALAGDPRGALAPEPRLRARADRTGFWWTTPTDSLGAYMVGAEGTVWELRLGRARGVFEGTLRRALPPAEPSPPAADVALAFLMRTPCREETSGE